jgi:DNA-binding CsgD family transcriptional regulator
MKPFTRCGRTHSRMYRSEDPSPRAQRQYWHMPSSEKFLVSPRLTGAHAGRNLHLEERDARSTTEEYKGVRLVALGYTDREVGREFFITEWTVRYHLRKVFRQFAIRRRLELVWLLPAHSWSDAELTAWQRIDTTPLPAEYVR